MVRLAIPSSTRASSPRRPALREPPGQRALLGPRAPRARPDQREPPEKRARLGPPDQREPREQRALLGPPDRREPPEKRALLEPPAPLGPRAPRAPPDQRALLEPRAPLEPRALLGPRAPLGPRALPPRSHQIASTAPSPAVGKAPIRAGTGRCSIHRRTGASRPGLGVSAWPLRLSSEGCSPVCRYRTWTYWRRSCCLDAAGAARTVMPTSSAALQAGVRPLITELGSFKARGAARSLSAPSAPMEATLPATSTRASPRPTESSSGCAPSSKGPIR